MEVRKRNIIDTQEDTARVLRRQFNDRSVESFVTQPMPGYANMPGMADYRCYGRLSGKRGEKGWVLTEEFFYGKGDDIPDNPKVQEIRVESGVDNAEAVKRVLAFKPTVFPGNW